MSNCNSDLFKNTKICKDKVEFYKKGQFISSKYCGIVLDGIIQVYSVSFDGCATLLSQLNKGDCFGISDLFSSDTLQTTLKCTEDCSILCVPKESILREINDNPEFALKMVKLYNQKIQFLLGRIEDLTIQSARKKLALYLINMSDDNGEIVFYSREDIANYIGISRASLFRELLFFKKQNIISLSGNKLDILNKNSLILYT